MFDKKEKPVLNVEYVIKSIKNSYNSEGGHHLKLNQTYIDSMIEYEKNYLDNELTFFELPSISVVSKVTNKIAVYFYDGKIVKGKIDNIYNILLQNENSTCPICGAHADTLDHVLPKTKYTQYAITPINLVPLCGRCNRKKGETIYSKNVGEVVFHPYFNDYHEMNGLTINYKINKKNNFIPDYAFDGSASKECIYNFDVVFKLNKVLSALALDEISKISRVILTKKDIAPDLKTLARNLILKKQRGLFVDLDEPWKIILYELLVNKFEDFYEYEIRRKLINCD